MSNQATEHMTTMHATFTDNVPRKRTVPNQQTSCVTFVFCEDEQAVDLTDLERLMAYLKAELNLGDLDIKLIGKVPARAGAANSGKLIPITSPTALGLYLKMISQLPIEQLQEMFELELTVELNQRPPAAKAPSAPRSDKQKANDEVPRELKTLVCE
jgi:hypothetical protein